MTRNHGKVRTESRIINLPPGLWQLRKYGALTALPELKQAIWIRGTFSRVELDSSKQHVIPVGNIHQTHDLPVGEIVAWEVGSIFNSITEQVLPPRRISTDIRPRQVTAAFSYENCRIIERFAKDDAGKYIISGRPSGEERESNNRRFLVVEHSGGLPLLIPCTTVLQAFWGKSSNIIHMLLDSRFADFNRYVANIGRSFYDKESKRAMVWLRQWSLDVDATFLATLACNPIAIKRGQQISAHLHAQSSGRAETFRHVIAYPPHEDEVTLLIEGMPTENNRFFYVQRILRSSYKPPFDDLLFDRDNDGRPSLDGMNFDPAKLKEMRRRRPSPSRFQATSNFKLSSEFPKQGSSLDPVEAGEFDGVFPGLNAVTATKLDQDPLQFKNIEDQESAVFVKWGNQISTLPATKLSSSDAIGKVLISKKAINNVHDKSTEPVGSPLNALLLELQAHAPFDSHVLLPYGVEWLNIEPTFPWQASAAHDAKWFFSLPFEHEDFGYAWLYNDPDCLQRKRGICLKISFRNVDSNRTYSGYVIDLESRTPRSNREEGPVKNQTSQLFLWGQSIDFMSVAEKDNLQKIILTLADKRGRAAIRIAQGLGFKCVSRHHVASGLTLNKLLEDLHAVVQGA